ncbi:FtsB family cell division protein [Corynebacterium freiburgense]|uniref:FtsB family cell division protein n=1 Tax=Corynebacterium freiburgense TaxID=556548 RepID=UPI000404AEA1|nr:septum formation initiator family protein [Corynebacterium freiburgense]WJZ02176.1 Cell division protein FtsB [Corynebacterium freiburgense]
MDRTARRVQPVTYRRSGTTATPKPVRTPRSQYDRRTKNDSYQRRDAQREQRPTQSQSKRIRLGAVEIGVLIAVSIVVLVMIGMPLRNYFQQRSDIARVQASIEAKEAEKQALLAELEKYESEEFIKEQARIRLGVIEPGETAFRIISPELKADSSTGQNAVQDVSDEPWYDVLWEAISLTESDLRIGLEKPEPPAANSNQLPISPTQPPVEEPIP